MTLKCGLEVTQDHPNSVSLSRGWTIATAFSLAATSNSQSRWQTSTCTELRSSSDLWRRPSRARNSTAIRDKLHWLRARERITFKLCLLVYKARNGMAPDYIQDLCVPVSTVSTALLSAPQLVETWSSLVPDDVSGIEHSASASPVLRRGTVCRRTFVLHQHSVLSKICSRLIYFFIHFNYQLNFEKHMLYSALVVTLWTCYGAL